MAGLHGAHESTNAITTTTIQLYKGELKNALRAPSSPFVPETLITSNDMQTTLFPFLIKLHTVKPRSENNTEVGEGNP